MSDDEWAEPQGEAPTDEETDHLSDLTDGGSIQSGDYWLTDDKGGTGGGPATLACHMHETARQALKLEGWWAQ